MNMRQRKKLISVLIIFGLVVGAFVLFNSLRREAAKSSDLDNEIERLQSEIDKLETRNSALVSLGKELSDLEFLEGEARIKMGMKLPGESVAVINRGASSFKTEEPAFAELRRGGSVWGKAGRWWQYFFNSTD